MAIKTNFCILYFFSFYVCVTENIYGTLYGIYTYCKFTNYKLKSKQTIFVI